VTRDELRQRALSTPDAVEVDHHGIPSFRIRGKIFCTIHLAQPRLMVKLDPEDQRNLVEGHPDVIEAAPGFWGLKGSTFVAYEQADDALIEALLRLAQANVTTARKKPRR
jgi:hypothetical protein